MTLCQGRFCKTFGAIAAFALLLTTVAVVAGCSNAHESLHEQTYRMLDSALEKRRDQLRLYLGSIQTQSRALAADSLMLRFFAAKNQYYHLRTIGQSSQEIEFAITTLKTIVDHHYLLNYLAFYDILFINKQGEIFYTIRKQNDYHRNIFTDSLGAPALARRLKESPKESFVGYEPYEISGEPSAFFVEPVAGDTGVTGWFVLQCSIDKINEIFVADKDLGQTGEVLLVNKDHYLLTDSRFQATSTILRQKLPAENIDNKFSLGSGHREVRDYRGYPALSSFDVSTILGSQWLIIAKIDKDEMLTRHYLRNSKRYANTLTAFPAAACRPLLETERLLQGFSGGQVEVSIDIFRRVDTSDIVFTRGVSTCTAFIVSYPGRFAYMAHVSPRDKLYEQTKTDLVGNILSRIGNYELPRTEQRNLHFFLVAPHRQTLDATARMLTEQGYFLSQLHPLIAPPGSSYGDVVHDCRSGLTRAHWHPQSQDGDVLRAEITANSLSAADMIEPLASATR